MRSARAMRGDSLCDADDGLCRELLAVFSKRARVSV
jgi:hypothetical protein